MMWIFLILLCALILGLMVALWINRYEIIMQMERAGDRIKKEMEEIEREHPDAPGHVKFRNAFERLRRK